eukprot:scaffold24669_cov124-Isochrysis_galbana.AAC.1
MEVVADAASDGVGRTASVEPACLASLGATPCDYLRLRVLRPAAGEAAPAAAAAASTLVKLSVASTGPQSTPPRIWLSGIVLAELGVGVGAVLGVELVHARAMRPWSALHVSPVAAATPSGATEPRAVWPSPLALPTAAEVRLSLGVGAPLRYHPWRSDCRCRETLVRHATRVSVGARLARSPLHAVAVGVGAGGGADGVDSMGDMGGGAGGRDVGGGGGVDGTGLAASAILSHRATGIRSLPADAAGDRAAAGAGAALAEAAYEAPPLEAEWGTVNCHTPVLFVAPHPPPHAPPPLPLARLPGMPPHPPPPGG